MRKKFAFIAYLHVLFFLLCPQLYPRQTGDVNDGGNINIVDALLINSYYVGLDPPKFHKSAADINGDGRITIIDTLLVAKYDVGLISEFAMRSETIPEVTSSLCGTGLSVDKAIDGFTECVRIDNNGFENTEGDNPIGWEIRCLSNDRGISEIRTVNDNPFSGNRCILVHNVDINYVRIMKTIQIPPHSHYKLSCRIRTENVSRHGKGAGISILDCRSTSKTLRGTHNEWVETDFYIKANNERKAITIVLF
ncbi:MAG: dockerin type I repeat-containing protein [Spirochaetales bacterium]|nr:dockerin type I repeat-containing protein [Spirochaetales bacterium]